MQSTPTTTLKWDAVDAELKRRKSPI